MKKSLISMAALLAVLVGCNKEPQQQTTADVDGKVYMQFSVNMLSTRSGTNDNGGSDATPGVEVGKDRENTITKVDVVLVNTTLDNGYVKTTVTGNNLEAATGVNNTYIASFQSEALTAGATYDVYIYANCDAPATAQIDATSSATVGSMTAENNFWMTNAYEAEKVTIPTDLSAHTQPNNPFNLGEHFVERSMARFDYMPKGPYTLADGVTVTLTEAALINQSKEFYLLRRTSADGTNTNWEIGGVEKKINYVVDTDYTVKAGGYTEAQVANFDDHMTMPAFWEWKSIAAKDLKEEDNWKGTDAGTTGAGSSHELNEYYIWQYAKENTIPGTEKQENGITTGVVFKGKLAGDLVTEAAGAQIFVFENKLYGTWASVESAAVQSNAPATLVSAVNKIESITGTPTAEQYAAAGFTGYNAVNEGTETTPKYAYYAYYYYWNRHNDNGNNDSMGPMEFAVVRNNVYKLCVDKIVKYGHPDPTDPNNPDPDKPNPSDPDEEIDHYFTVTVKVLPWVVRVNHIEF